MDTSGTERAVGYLVKRVQQSLRRRSDAALRSTGLSMAQYAVLRALADHPEASASELSRLCFVTRQSLQDVLSGLRSSGLVSGIRSTVTGARPCPGVDGRRCQAVGGSPRRGDERGVRDDRRHRAERAASTRRGTHSVRREPRDRMRGRYGRADTHSCGSPDVHLTPEGFLNMKSGRVLLVVAVVLAVVAASCSGKPANVAPNANTATPIHHLVVIFQENVSFDHYFGTYPQRGQHRRSALHRPAGNADR